MDTEVLTTTTSFQNASISLPSLETEQEVIENAFTIHGTVKSWFIKRNFQEANAALDLLMSMKVVRSDTGKIIDLKMRRNGITPDFIHELHQVLSIIADHQAGLIEESQLQTAIVTALMHDLGEDFALLPNQTLNLLHKAIGTSTENIKEHVRRMEILTFDRAYTAKEVLKEIKVSKDKIVQEHHLRLLQEKLENESNCLEDCDLEPIQFLPEPSRKGTYRFSRYIHDGIIDWNSYATAFSNDEYTAYGKIKDRNDGLGTRIGKYFDLDSYSTYLSQTYQSFSIDNIGKRAAKTFPQLKDAIHANDSMMFVLHRIGRTYLRHHPENNPPGGKGYNINTMLPVDFRGRIPAALTGYKNMPLGTNPLYIILDRIKNGETCDGQKLNSVLVSSIEQDISITTKDKMTQHIDFVKKL